MTRKVNNPLSLLKISLSFIFLFAYSQPYAGKIIVHPGHEYSAISQNKLRAIYSMRVRVWPDGTPIAAFILNPDSATHRNFCLTDLEIFPYQMQRVWDIMVYSGTGQSPIEVKSETEMIRNISLTPGAIGYISDGGATDNVYVIDIQK